ncbi:unnamed protein product [Alternaria alternata]
MAPKTKITPKPKKPAPEPISDEPPSDEYTSEDEFEDKEKDPAKNTSGLQNVLAEQEHYEEPEEKTRSHRHTLGRNSKLRLRATLLYQEVRPGLPAVATHRRSSAATLEPRERTFDSPDKYYARQLIVFVNLMPVTPEFTHKYPGGWNAPDCVVPYAKDTYHVDNGLMKKLAADTDADFDWDDTELSNLGQPITDEEVEAIPYRMNLKMLLGASPSSCGPKTYLRYLDPSHTGKDEEDLSIEPQNRAAAIREAYNTSIFHGHSGAKIMEIDGDSNLPIPPISVAFSRIERVWIGIVFLAQKEGQFVDNAIQVAVENHPLSLPAPFDAQEPRSSSFCDPPADEDDLKIFTKMQDRGLDLERGDDDKWDGAPAAHLDLEKYYPASDSDDNGDNGGNNASMDILAGLDTGHDNTQTDGKTGGGKEEDSG